MKSEIEIREARKALQELAVIAEEMGLKSFPQVSSVQAFCELLSWVLDEEDFVV